ncbi:MAG: hypothetical protein LBR36_00410 [Bacteroidales bacterium]|jgi:hypothetical protein|nr:hypothetical protein [Bacteroidales bacterium]
MDNKTKRTIIAFVIILNTCIGYAQKQRNITYLSHNSLISFYQNGCFVQKYIYQCDIEPNKKIRLDTLSYGVYEKRGKCYILNTAQEITEPDSTDLHKIISEEYLPNDTLTLKILSPYESMLLNDTTCRKVFFYVIKIECTHETESQLFEEKFNSENSYFLTNEISFFKPQTVGLKKIKIYIYPYLYPFVVWQDYEVVNIEMTNSRNNYFTIELPYFSYFFPVYFRYKREYVPIIGKIIALNGNEYIERKKIQKIEQRQERFSKYYHWKYWRQKIKAIR